MSAQPQIRPTDHRALLASIGSRRVRNVAAEVSPFAEALFNVVAERKPRGESWHSDEWAALLDELDTSTLTVSEFLAAEHAKGKR
jgi:hypothetical protein